MLYFSLSIKDMNLLVRLVRYINFQCHFVSEVAGDFRQSKRDNRRLPATNDSPECARLNAPLKLAVPTYMINIFTPLGKLMYK